MGVLPHPLHTWKAALRKAESLLQVRAPTLVLLLTGRVALGESQHPSAGVSLFGGMWAHYGGQCIKKPCAWGCFESQEAGSLG